VKYLEPWANPIAAIPQQQVVMVGNMYQRRGKRSRG